MRRESPCRAGGPRLSPDLTAGAKSEFAGTGYTGSDNFRLFEDISPDASLQRRLNRTVMIDLMYASSPGERDAPCLYGSRYRDYGMARPPTGRTTRAGRAPDTPET